jgi:DNA-directed RNA polymerase beta' subunit
MTRKLTETEIEEILDFIQPQPDIPLDTAMSIVNKVKNGFRKQLHDQFVYPEIIPELKQELATQYRKTLIIPGESVGIVCAQSIGEMQTQTTLNSVAWEEKLLYTENGKIRVECIGQMIDRLLQIHNSDVFYIDENRTEYLELSTPFTVPSCDENGVCKWYKIEAITRHLPVGDLVRITTESGRTVVATQSKSFLTWNGTKFVSTLGSDVIVGDILPTTRILPRMHKIQEVFYLNGTQTIYLSNSLGFLLGAIFAPQRRVRASGITRTVLGPYIHNNFTMNTYRRLITCLSNLNFPYMDMEDNELSIYVDSPVLDAILENTDYNNLIIPEFVYSAPISFVRSFLSGYFSIALSVNQKDKMIEVKNSNVDFLHGITFLLTYFDVFTHVKMRTNETMEHTLAIAKNELTTFLRKIDVIDNSTRNDILGLTQPKPKSLCKRMFERVKNFFSSSSNNGYEPLLTTERSDEVKRDVYFDRVVKIDYIEPRNMQSEYVYDLTVETTRNFQLFNGLNMRDTFHKAGQSEKTMTSGVPRFKELIDATENPRIVNHTIYFKYGNRTIQELRRTVGNQIVGLTLADISSHVSVQLYKKAEKWYDTYKLLYNDKFSSHSHCISFKLNTKKLFEFNLTIKQIANVIEEEYSDLFCVCSPLQDGQLDIFVDTTNVTLPPDRIVITDKMAELSTLHSGLSDVTDSNIERKDEDISAIMIYMEGCVQVTLEKMYVCGIPGITEIFYTTKDGEWIAETNGFNNKTTKKKHNSFLKLLSLDMVDETKTTSNNVWDIWEVFGIEAAREFLIDEFSTIMDNGVNMCHIMLLCDRMTFGGSISSITRYTLKKDESGPMGKASFEESLDNFLKAGAQGQNEPTKGVSASIICGKRAEIGTGMMKISIDVMGLPKLKEELPSIKEKKPLVNSKKTILSYTHKICKATIKKPEKEDIDEEDIPDFEEL